MRRNWPLIWRIPTRLAFADRMNRATVAGDRPKWRLTSIHSTTEDITKTRTGLSGRLPRRSLRKVTAMKLIGIALAPVLSDTGNLVPTNASATTCSACRERLLLRKEKRNFFFEEKVYSYPQAEAGVLGHESKPNKWGKAVGRDRKSVV